MAEPTAMREMTYGEKAVGLTFNPSQDPAVYQCKRKFAELMDDMGRLRNASASGEVWRMAEIAMTELQTAQMWAVKAITWQF